ncbi:MAG: type II toxin-antitoxin system HicB family antitoxin [Methylacidiphilales bacterium]|nr:type II toxin-antitoxin system HicB family antitoxin [Candidatus Methylacidiphilales bacterium]
MASYPVKLVQDESGLRVSCRDLPEVLTWGDTCEEALSAAADAIEVVVASAVEGGREVPSPSIPDPDEELVPLPAWLSTLLQVRNTK